MPHHRLLTLSFVALIATWTHAQEEQHEHTNRLAKESSPYLLQHAHNPVDWYPWGEEALEKARREDKLVFLSVGYAACHWCHVMERESFMDPEIAKAMNERFVCVKVDREERPDIDQIYMLAVQLISRGSGGWPMSVFLLPDGRPFWGGTYFPARTGDRGRSAGFLSIMKQIDDAWTGRREDVTKQAQALTDAIRTQQELQFKSDSDLALDGDLIQSVVDAMSDRFDPAYGGFGMSSEVRDVPKFPEPSNLFFLLDRIRRDSVSNSDREAAKGMLLKTLNGMISGAMYDHLGGGFHRYSVDRRWQIPHFEKMLYDNGQLASIYSEVHADTGSAEYRAIAEGICDFALRELQAPGGAFFSSLDADSEGEEGKFYRWTKEEIQTAGSEASEANDPFKTFTEIYSLEGEPNFEEEFYVPEPKQPMTDVAREREQELGELMTYLEPTREKLFEIRSKRVRPPTDIKILTAWNGLMISGLADTGRILGRDDYKQAAASAAEFLLDNVRDSDGRLLRSYAGGEAKLNAYLDDYAFLASAMRALHRATGEQRWLDLMREITDKQIELFWDKTSGGFYFTSNDHASLIIRSKDMNDTAIPSGASVSAENLLYLSQNGDGNKYRERLEQTLRSFLPLMDRAPGAAPRATSVMAEFVDAKMASETN